MNWKELKQKSKTPYLPQWLPVLRCFFYKTISIKVEIENI